MLLTAALPRPTSLYSRRKWQLIGKSQWCCSANCGHPLHALTYNWTRGMQLTNTTAPINHTRPSPCKHSPDVATRARKQTSDCSLLLIYRPRKDERLSWPGWLVTYRNKVPPPGVKPRHVIHLSTNRARRRVTSLIRPTPLPLRHAANHTSGVCQFWQTMKAHLLLYWCAINRIVTTKCDN